jgi:hypothetical protein
MNKEDKILKKLKVNRLCNCKILIFIKYIKFIGDDRMKQLLRSVSFGTATVIIYIHIHRHKNVHIKKY